MKIVKKIMKWMGIGIGMLLVLIMLASLIMNVVFGRELRQTMAKFKAEGRALTVAEIRPAPIPDDKNAAPLIAKASALITNAPATSAIKELSSLITTNNSVLDISVWPATHREALPRLIQAPEMQALFAVLHEASQKSGYNNNLKYEDGPGMLLPNLISFRQMARFLSIKAELATQDGNGAEAWATVLEGLELFHLLKQEPGLITQLVRIACNQILIDRLERMADKTDVSPDQARILIAELAQHTDATSWIRSMDVEVVMGLWCFQAIQHGSFRDFKALVDENAPQWFFWGLKYAYAPISKKDITVYLNLMSQQQDYYKMPYWEAAEIMQNHPLDQQLPPYYILTRMLIPNFNELVKRKAEHDAAVNISRVGLALKLFKQKNGAYPDTLEKLAPEFLANIPVDPCTGKALIYRKADAGFILYSLGKDQQDDNGKPKPTGKKDTGKEPYDIVWKCER